MATPARCKVCALRSTFPGKILRIHALLVEKPYAEVAHEFGFTVPVMRRHLEHEEVVRAARRAFLSEGPKVPANAHPAGAPPMAPPQVPSPGRNHTRSNHLQGLELERRAWDLRVARQSYVQIAEALDIRTKKGAPDPATARAVVVRGMQRCAALTQEAVGEWRAMELATLDEIDASIRDRALRGEVHVVGAAGEAQIYRVSTEAQDRAVLLRLQVSDRRRRLLGLDAPKPLPSSGGISLNAMGLTSLPPPLASLDPPPTQAELERYIDTGEIPRRNAAPTEPSYARTSPHLLEPPRPPAPAPPEAEVIDAPADAPPAAPETMSSAEPAVAVDAMGSGPASSPRPRQTRKFIMPWAPKANT